MGTIKKFFRGVKSLKINIKSRKRRLFLAAVILFCLSFTLIGPIKDTTQTILSDLNNNRSKLEAKKEKGDSLRG